MNLLAVAALLAWSAPQDASKLLIDDGARFTTQRTVTLTVRPAPSEPAPAEMATSSNGREWSPWRPFAATSKFDLPEGDGINSVFVRLSDGDGKELAPLFAVIRLDTTPPTVDVAAPSKVPGTLVTLTSNVPDAVAMQFAGENGPWSDWEPYARPRSMLLSPGDGHKLVQVRYRDEAGNISEAAQVRVEVDSALAPDDKPGVQDARIVVAHDREDGLTILVDVAARGMTEMEALLDGEVFRPRAEFSPTLELTFPKSGQSHRLTLKLWDAEKKEHLVELSFVEQGLPYPTPDPAAKPVTPFVQARLGVGLWVNGLTFDADTTVGPRELKPGAMAAIQLSVALNVLDPVYVELSGEHALGQDAAVTTFGVDIGVRLYRGPLLFDDVEVRAHAGLLLSTLSVDDADFGDFDTGVGGRIGVSARVGVTDRLSLEAGLQFRAVSYQWSDTVLLGDDKADATGAALLLGLSWGF